MSSQCFVTGATGFVGANLVSELNQQGVHVKALIRSGANLKALEGLDYEPVTGTLSDLEALKSGMQGCDRVYHVAAGYSLWAADYGPMYAANVQGSRDVCETAWRMGVERIVYTSTVGCIGLPSRRDESGKWVPSNETATTTEQQMSNHYKRSKWLGEQEALWLAKEGAPIVIVNPSAPIGPRDSKPTPTGQVIVDFLRRALPAYLETGLNWVHVSDVAKGHILAAEKGIPGERYILGNREGNWTMKETLQTLSEITGIPAPKFRSPYWLAWMAGCFSEGLSKITKRPPKAPLGGVKMAKYMMYFDPSKAIEQLGLPQTDPRIALEDAVQWYIDHGYA